MRDGENLSSPNYSTHYDASALDGLSIDELTRLIDHAKQVRADKVEKARVALVGEMRQKAAALGLQLESLLGSESSPGKTRSLQEKPSRPVPPKYRGPQGEEWSGRGRTPRWLAALETTGRHRDEFKV